MYWRTLLLGSPIASEDEQTERIGPLAGVSLLGLDGLASAAYGPEALLTVLLPLGAAALKPLLPLTLVIVGLLTVLFVSYRQTISAYPNGGGSFTVAKENLGEKAGLLAAAALLLDYTLNVAVAISAGVGALVSAVPRLLPYTLVLCLAVLLALTLINLRGVRTSSKVFLLPTCLFVGMLALTLAIGLTKTIVGHGAAAPVVAPPRPEAPIEAASIWLLLRAFASGCTAMTGIEAVSNGVPVFREPQQKEAKRTLGAIIGLLIALLAGIAILCRSYGITATVPGRTGYQSILSQLVAAVAGRGAFYYVGIGAIVAVLGFSANTSFADFPRLCRLLALDRSLPESFAHRGRRLVYSHGIVMLAVLAGVLLIAFGGVTDGLIPLFAIGALLAFTLSQAGMVNHWKHREHKHAKAAMAINLIGAVSTGCTLTVVLVSKFTEGAWISVLLVGAVVLSCSGIRRHFVKLESALATDAPLEFDAIERPRVLVPIHRWNKQTRKALHIACNLSDAVEAVQVLADERDPDDLRHRWGELVEAAARTAGMHPPTLVVIRSEYRRLFEPLLDHIRKTAARTPERPIAVVIPELVERRWYHQLLHGNRGALLSALLLLEGCPRVLVINSPWYVEPANFCSGSRRPRSARSISSVGAALQLARARGRASREPR